MDILMKRDRAILDYLIHTYGKDLVKKEIVNINKDILLENYKEYKIKNNNLK